MAANERNLWLDDFPGADTLFGLVALAVNGVYFVVTVKP